MTDHSDPAVWRDPNQPVESPAVTKTSTAGVWSSIAPPAEVWVPSYPETVVGD